MGSVTLTKEKTLGAAVFNEGVLETPVLRWKRQPGGIPQNVKGGSLEAKFSVNRGC